MIKFKEKSFSNYIASGAGKGALAGASLGSLIVGAKSNLVPHTIENKSSYPKFINKGIDKYNNMKENRTVCYDKDKNPYYKNEPSTSGLQRLAAIGFTTLIGAALGTLVGVVKEVNKMVSHSNANNRLMGGILKELKSKGFREGTQFTRDPKQANFLKTKVCIVITNDAADFKMLVNTIDDKKLKSVTDKILRGLRGEIQVRNNLASNKYNEINISTISNTSSNIKTASEIIGGFILEGFPVYIVEVG